MPLTLFTRNLVANHMLTDPTWVPGSTLYVGLSTTTPVVAGTGATEPVGNGYARVPITAGMFGAASAGNKTNTQNIIFGVASGGWGTLTYGLLYDALTAGNLLGFGLLEVARVVILDDIVEFIPGEFNIGG